MDLRSCADNAGEAAYGIGYDSALDYSYGCILVNIIQDI
jgi:hypothetical protein